MKCLPPSWNIHQIFHQQYLLPSECKLVKTVYGISYSYIRPKLNRDNFQIVGNIQIRPNLLFLHTLLTVIEVLRKILKSKASNVQQNIQNIHNIENVYKFHLFRLQLNKQFKTKISMNLYSTKKNCIFIFNESR